MTGGGSRTVEPMRARWGAVVGWVVVVAYAALLVVAAVDGAGDQHRVVRGAPGTTAADRFVAAWERSRSATFVASGTFERRSALTGARIASEDVVAQRPPRRLHRQLGAVEGRDDDRLLVCPAPPDGVDRAPCQLGEPGGPTYAESVAAEVSALRSLVGGRPAVYAVRETAAACFALEQVRVEPRAPFGIRARFCFDDATGATSATRVEYEGGIVEVLVVTALRSDVQEEDLQP